jgi:hypothetical protein
MANNQSTAGYPGFSSLYEYYSAYIQGLGNLSQTYNDTWDAAVNGPNDYSFGAWVKDFGKIWSLNYDLFTKLARFPLSSGDRNRPVWVPIVADLNSTSPASAWVTLDKSVDSQQAPAPTNLERLGGGGASIPAAAVNLELNDQRDAIRVTIPIKKKGGKAPYGAGTYVGFVKIPGGAGAPVAIIFFSYGT